MSSMGSRQWHPTETKPFHLATDERHEAGHEHVKFATAHSPKQKDSTEAKTSTKPHEPSMGSKKWHPTETKEFHFHEHPKHAFHAPKPETAASPSASSHRTHHQPSMGDKNWRPTDVKEFHFHEHPKHEPHS
mmetsp:Transcript_23450/g.50828  ORF Transcript_23450/g.50828 Transcript_23450/m.50828 type:complete len:132 (-) Transcript_23450:968-1363(-)|eukprot:CAMPEP_0168777228 /NCGR_PEP_ID=MMETSP0725-20121227/6446_1 /TAXON_ID=265536 /ORGANISM="Amphiprora sp., Strain CCMP467" /LENGTH=131 /DNA_ID=CAMNT_0008826935 /DNA_START=146 /DNA_END=541 /DNA_ORIENTATION=-